MPANKRAESGEIAAVFAGRIIASRPALVAQIFRQFF
jgi:hypothetical protein